MKIYNITDKKSFTTKLFLEEVFDNFLLVEANFITDFGIYFDGHRTGYEIGEDEHVTWGIVRNQAFTAIKGSKLPKSFKIVFRLSGANTANTVRSLGISDVPDVALYLNIRYNEDRLDMTAGVSTPDFFASKSIETGWEHYLEKFFMLKDISYEEE
ncbi:MAG: hypothetical protein IJU01_07780 [Lachnospiraceae bacterium]|nr:hypothetical protein [Lachnospiraceae bacterium]